MARKLTSLAGGVLIIALCLISAHALDDQRSDDIRSPYRTHIEEIARVINEWRMDEGETLLDYIDHVTELRTDGTPGFRKVCWDEFEELEE